MLNLPTVKKNSLRFVLAMDSYGVAKAIEANHDPMVKQQRIAACYSVHYVAIVFLLCSFGKDGKGKVPSYIRSALAKAIDGTMYRAAWDLGDATESRIAFSVASQCEDTLRECGVSDDTIKARGKAVKADILANAEKPNSAQKELF